jgi:hypothetical protein
LLRTILRLTPGPRPHEIRSGKRYITRNGRLAIIDLFKPIIMAMPADESGFRELRKQQSGESRRGRLDSTARCRRNF